MRYRDTGNVHKDFHLATDRTVRYVTRRYGTDFLEELFRRTAQLVYRDIYENLKSGKAEPLVEHWKYYYEREAGVFEVEQTDDEIVFTVKDCPAIRHLKGKGVTVDQASYQPTILMNRAWSEGTPFGITTDIDGDGAYTMTIRRGPHAAE